MHKIIIILSILHRVAILAANLHAMYTNKHPPYTYRDKEPHDSAKVYARQRNKKNPGAGL